jgi:phage replication-related protein YjqB (UPF0714/DUF867 family)
MHQDKYPNFAALARSQKRNTDYSIECEDRGTNFVIVAPHAGGIEPGTTEIVRALAGANLSYYLFQGLKRKNNLAALHITSTKFDEPQCLALLQAAAMVLAVHGENSNASVVYIGGLHGEAKNLVRAALEERRFVVREHPKRYLQGRERRNLCNIGRNGGGIQLELTKGLRRTLFESLKPSGRTRTTARFTEFCGAVRSALSQIQWDNAAGQ